jgi:hypothetical protein
MAMQDAPSIVAYYGTAASCVRYLLHPIDWSACQNAPDKALWSLSAQSGTIIDKSVAVACLMMGNPGTTIGYVPSAKGEYLEPGYAANSPSNTLRQYPFPKNGA